MTNNTLININGVEIDPNNLDQNFSQLIHSYDDRLTYLKRGLSVKYVNVFKWLASCGRVCTNIAGGQNSRDKRSMWTEEVFDKNGFIHGFVNEVCYDCHGFKLMKNDFHERYMVQTFSKKSKEKIDSHPVENIYHLQNKHYGLKFFWLSTKKDLYFQGLWKQIEVTNYYDRSYSSKWVLISDEYCLKTGNIKTNIKNLELFI